MPSVLLTPCMGLEAEVHLQHRTLSPDTAAGGRAQEGPLLPSGGKKNVSSATKLWGGRFNQLVVTNFE